MPAAAKKRDITGKQVAYLALVVLLFLVSSMNIQRIPPILTRVRDALGIGDGLAGVLVSVNTFMSLFLSIPFGVLLRRIGFRLGGLLSAAMILIGSFVGAVSADFGGMMLSQLLTGVGGAMIVVLCPSFTLSLFSERHRSTALAITNSAQVMAQFLSYNITPRITTDEHISPAWWLTCFASLGMLVLWTVFVRKRISPVDVGGQSAEEKESPSPSAQKLGVGSVLADRRILMITIGAFFYATSAMSILGFLSPYLQEMRGIDVVTASTMCSFHALVGIVSSPLCGLLADRLQTRKWIYFALVTIMASLRVLQICVPSGALYPIVVFVQGIPAGGLALAMGAASQICRDPRQRPLAVAMVSTASMGGNAVSTAVFGVMIQNLGYNTSFLIMAPITFLALVGMMTCKDVR